MAKPSKYAFSIHPIHLDEPTSHLKGILVQRLSARSIPVKEKARPKKDIHRHERRP